MKEYIIGKNTILETIKYKKKNILKIFTCLKKENFLVKEIVRNNIPIEYTSKKKLDSLVKTSSHRNFVAQIKKREFFTLKEFLKKEINSLLILDNIYDPHNMGALIRCAECFQMDGVLFSKNRGSGITPVVTGASSGATQLLPLIKVSNIAESIRKCKEHGFTILACDVGENSLDLFNFSFPKKIVLVMGSEGRGVSSLCKKLSDFLIKIPMFGKIDSLNVSQAAAVVLSFFRRSLAKR